MKFRVTLIEIPKRRNGNPFVIGLINDTSVVRTVEIEADSEQQVRDFYDEAVRENYSSVQGFELGNIVAVDPNSLQPKPLTACTGGAA